MRVIKSLCSSILQLQALNNHLVFSEKSTFSQDVFAMTISLDIFKTVYVPHTLGKCLIQCFATDDVPM